MMRPRWFHWVAYCAMALVLAACSGSENDDLNAYFKDVKARKSAKIAPVPEVKASEPFTYQAAGRNDPFVSWASLRSEVPPTVAAAGGGVRPDAGRRKEPLEEYPLDTLRMVGSVDRNGEHWAIVRVPDGVVYRVKKGNHMGQNFGRITKVLEDKMEIAETVPDGLGGWMERLATVTAGAETAKK